MPSMSNSNTPKSEGLRQVSKRSHVFALIVTSLLVSLIGLGCLEVVFRCFVPVTDMYFTFWDPVLGPRVAPRQSGRHIRGDTFSTRFNFNSQGWNHQHDYEVFKKPGTQRICLIGDSQVESLQVNPDQTMFAVAERDMNHSGHNVEWYAFGNSGWGTNAYYDCLRHYVLDYQPDVVIVLFVQNDPFDCSPYLVDLGKLRPVYYLDESGELARTAPDPNWRPSLKLRLVSYSALARYFLFQQRLYDRIVAGSDIRPGIGGLPLLADSETSSASFVPGLAKMDRQTRDQMTWKLIEKLLIACRDDCRSRGAVFAVAFRGWMPEIDSTWLGQPFKAADSKDPYCLGDRVSEMGREMIAPMAKRLGIPYLDLTNALMKMVEQSGQSHVFVKGRQYVDHHYNAAAHAAAGKALADWVSEILQEQHNTRK